MVRRAKRPSMGAERRRRWPAAEKVGMVRETYEPGMTMSLVARPQGITRTIVPLAQARARRCADRDGGRRDHRRGCATVSDRLGAGIRS